MDESEYRYFPMIMDQYRIGKYLEKGWWIRSAAGTVMMILYGDQNIEHTHRPLKEGESDLQIKGENVFVSHLGSFSLPNESEFLFDAIRDKDVKDLVEEGKKGKHSFRMGDKKANDFRSWTIFRLQTKKEKQNACHGTLSGLEKQEVCDGCAKKGKGFCDN